MIPVRLQWGRYNVSRWLLDIDQSFEDVFCRLSICSIYFGARYEKKCTRSPQKPTSRVVTHLFSPIIWALQDVGTEIPKMNEDGDEDEDKGLGLWRSLWSEHMGASEHRLYAPISGHFNTEYDHFSPAVFSHVRQIHITRSCPPLASRFMNPST